MYKQLFKRMKGKKFGGKVRKKYKGVKKGKLTKKKIHKKRLKWSKKAEGKNKEEKEQDLKKDR